MLATLEVDLHRSQYEAHIDPARFKVLACGRRWGKTRLGVNECIDIATRGGRAWWVAPNYKMSEVGWRPLRKVATLLGAEVRKVDRQIIMPGGGDVTVRSADNTDSLRGEGLDLAILDECAFMTEEAWTEAIRPALSDRQGKAIFISTPKGRNWFWRLFQRGLDGGDWASWQKPTSDNPFIDPDEIEAARLTLPELTFEQEYMAVFLESAGAVFRNLEASLTAPEHTSAIDHERHKFIVGVDWGKQSDFTAVSVGCVDCHCEVARDRFNKIDYEYQLFRLRSLISQWPGASILPERNSMGGPLVDRLLSEQVRIMAGQDGKPGFETTAASKPQLIENLALAIERVEWRLQDEDLWRGELEAYERQISPTTGRSQYSAPVGMHDDTVIARALMVWAAGNAKAMPEAQPTQRSKWTDYGDQPDSGSRWRRY